MRQEKRIPTLLGLLLLTVFIFGGVLITQKNAIFKIKASPTCQPINPQVGNITNNSADISFLTESECSIVLKIDNKTFTNFKESSKVQYFQINNLKESTTYTYSFIADSREISSDSYTFKTAKKPTGNMPTSNLAWGKIYLPSQKPAADAIVYLNIPGASPLSSLVTTSGFWNISLATSFNLDKNSWFTPTKDSSEDIVVLYPGYEPTQISSNTSQNDPVPDIIVGQNSFSKSQLNTGSLNTPDLETSSNIPLDISNPQNNETIKTQKPDFFGSAPPGFLLDITVESPLKHTGQVSSGNDGSWNWSPPSNLSPGEHTITVKATDPQTGAIQTIVRKFYVLAAEDDTLAFTASESAFQPSPTPTQKPSPTPLPTKPTTPQPTKIPVITSSKPSPVPTLISETPGTQSGIPVAGTSLPTLATITFSLLLLTAAKIISKKPGI